jgi:hypothetical protein
MTATFDYAEHVCEASNGFIVTYCELMAVLAASQLGRDDPLTRFLQDSADHWYPGFGVFLDEALVDGPSRAAFIRLLDQATEQFFDGRGIEPANEQRLRSKIRALRERIQRDVDRPSANGGSTG